MKKFYSNKQRNIWKLKRKNVVLGQWKEQLLQKGVDKTNLNIKEATLPCCLDILDVYRISQLSFQIGKNSAKIQRLRTLIQQEKKLLNYFEEIDIIYQHPLDEDCVILRTELGVTKLPKSILNHPRLTEYLEKYK